VENNQRTNQRTNQRSDTVASLPHLQKHLPLDRNIHIEPKSHIIPDLVQSSFGSWEKDTTSRTAKNLLDSLVRFLNRSKRTILLVLGVAAITLSLSIIIPILIDRTTHLNLPSMGTIHTIDVKAYWDASLENEIDQSIEWGTIYTGSSNNVTIYLQVTSNVQTILELETGNWTFLNSANMNVSEPSDSTQHLNLTWNYNNATLSPGETIPVTLTLSADDSSNFVSFLIDKAVKYFSFDIVISASEEH
jgi:hypothetical protein